MALAVAVIAFSAPTTVQAYAGSCGDGSLEGVYLYADPNYEGDCAYFSDTDFLPTANHSLRSTEVGNNTASSIRVVGNYRVELFVHSNYEGTSSTFVGDDPDFGDDVIAHERASSITLIHLSGVCSRGDGVYLFERPSCAGRATRVEAGQDITNLSSTNLGNDTASSISIGGEYAVTLFPHADYGGEPNVFVRSDRNLGDNTIGRGATSVRVRASRCDDKPGVYLYEESDGGGRCSKFRISSPNLSDEYVLNDQASSLRMIGDYQVTVFRHGDFRGDGSAFAGEALDFGDQRIGHDRASSIRVVPRTLACTGEPGVYLFEDPNFGGTCTRFTDDMGSLSSTLLRPNSASSLSIQGNYTATLYNGPGIHADDRFQTTFTTSDPDLSDDEIGDNRTSSIKVEGPSPEQEEISRIQVHILTADVDDAGTDDDVVISLNPNNSTWLDSPKDDFERGGAWSYDLRLVDVDLFNDIDWLTVTKTGDEGWCVARIDLLVNEVLVYRRVFNPCHWFDNDDGHTRFLAIRHSELRQEQWDRYDNPDPGAAYVFEREEVIRQVEALVGHELHFEDRARWGEISGEAVEISGDGKQTLSVDLDLSGDTNYPDPAVDVDIDVVFRCDPADPSVIVVSVEAEVEATWDIPVGLVGHLLGLEERIESQVEAALAGVGSRVDYPGNGECVGRPPIVVDEDGRIRPG
jgi:hypothetical protein